LPGAELRVDQMPPFYRDGFLTPSRRRELEELVRVADQQAKTAPPLLRLRLERGRDLVALMLKAAGPEGSVEEHDRLDAMLRIELAGQPWPGDPKPSKATVQRHARAEKLARRVCLTWIGHPAIRREVEASRPELMALVEALGMPDQLTVTRVTARFLESAPYWPDGTEWPSPFEGAAPAVLQEAQRIRPVLVGALVELAKRIESAGAPLDPTDAGVLLALAQLCLLEVDLTRPAADLVEDLNLLPPGWIDREAATIGHVATHTSRHGRTARFQADLAASAEWLARRLGPPALRTPYASGVPRKPAARCGRDRRHKALREVLKSHPTVTPGQIRATWSASLTTPGGLLRYRMGLQPHDSAPGESTLRADLNQLRRLPNSPTDSR
jgi:hypothetical protein